jgi:hypothetical protein
VILEPEKYELLVRKNRALLVQKVVLFLALLAVCLGIWGLCVR